MHSYNRYSDALALKRKRSVLKRLALAIFFVLALGIATGYFLFFTPYLQINNISVNGLGTIDINEVDSLLKTSILNNTLEVFRFVSISMQKNILFFNIDIAQDKILAQFPVFKSIEIKKEYPNKIILSIVEREPSGTWCFIDKCNYFDEDGVLWGQALRSSGPLLLIVEDKRTDIINPKSIEPVLLESIKKLIAGFDSMEIGIRGIEIPADSINDIRVNTTKDYYILVNTDSDINTQLDTLNIFLKNKGENFHPEYVDIRIEGRVYYK